MAIEDKKRFPGNPLIPWAAVVTASAILPGLLLSAQLALLALASTLLLLALYWRHPVYVFLRTHTTWFKGFCSFLFLGTAATGILAAYITPGQKVLWVLVWLVAVFIVWAKVAKKWIVVRHQGLVEQVKKTDLAK